jgi:predicted metal-dependent HD superfamily phosphohydrolase
MNLNNLNPFTYNKDFLYKKWEELIYNLSYNWQSETVSDKWFRLLDEYYTKSDTYFSTWARVENSVNAINNFCNETKKISINNEDLLMLASFFTYVDYDATNCDNYLDSGILAAQFCEDLEISNQDSKLISSLLSSFDYRSVFDEEHSITYHAFRDANLIWTAVKPENYIKLIDFMRNEVQMPDNLWYEFRKYSAQEMLEGQPVMHTDYFFYLYAEQIQNNLLDELQIYSEIKV